MNIYDCFTYFNEDVLLEIRMETLDRHVNYFVIAESTHTQSGLPKPLNFRLERFGKFQSKIIYVVVNDMPLHLNNTWANENHQRKSLMRGLIGARPEDLVIVSDLDEIPNPLKITLYKSNYLRATFIQRLFYYKFNNEAVNPITHEPVLWRGSQMTSYRHLVNFFGDTQNLRIYNPTGPLRSIKRQWLKRFRNMDIDVGGWHFSWVMSDDRMLEKIKSMAHQEYNTPDIASLKAINSALLRGEDILRRNIFFRKLDIDDSFPEYIVANRLEFDEYMIKESNTCYADQKIPAEFNAQPERDQL